MKVFLRHAKRGQVEQLYPFVLLVVLVGMVIGIGVLVLQKFGAAVSYTRTNHNDSFTSNQNNYTFYVLDHGNISNVRSLLNESGGVAPSGCYATYANGTIVLNNYLNDTCGDVVKNMSLSIIYDWTDYDTETKRATSYAYAEVAGIASNWLGLIVTVVILSILLFLVISSFKPGMER